MNETHAAPEKIPAQASAPAFWDALPADLRERESLRKFKDPAALARSYVELESLMGQGGRMAPPADTDPGDRWEEFFDRMGRPQAPEGYELAAPDLPREVFGPEHMTHFRALAHQSGLNTRQAGQLLSGYARLVQSGLAEQQAARERHRQSVLETLRLEYGDGLETKMAMARRAARDFGGEDLALFLREQDLADDPRLLAAFIRAGEALMEDRLRPGDAPGLSLSPNEARAEIARLHTDAEFQTAYRDRLHPAHDAGVERMRRLFEQAYPEGGRE